MTIAPSCYAEFRPWLKRLVLRILKKNYLLPLRSKISTTTMITTIITPTTAIVM